MNAKIVYVDDIAINVLLVKKRMTKKELCHITGINTGNMSMLLKRGTVRPKTANQIAAALGVEVSEIIKLPEESR